jgi:hypothetical protein
MNTDKQYSADVPALMRDSATWDTPETVFTRHRRLVESVQRRQRPHSAPANEPWWLPADNKPRRAPCKSCKQGRGRNPNQRPDTTLARVLPALIQE